MSASRLDSPISICRKTNPEHDISKGLRFLYVIVLSKSVAGKDKRRKGYPGLEAVPNPTQLRVPWLSRFLGLKDE